MKRLPKNNSFLYWLAALAVLANMVVCIIQYNMSELLAWLLVLIWMGAFFLLRKASDDCIDAASDYIDELEKQIKNQNH